MPYDRLIKGGRIKSYITRSSEIEQLLKVASRDLNASARNLDDDPDWAYSMAYNAILQASRALMLSNGYRPRGSEQHATVVECVKEMLGPTYADQINLFDQMRRIRHRVICEAAGLVLKSEAEQATIFSKNFVGKIAEIITKQHGLEI